MKTTFVQVEELRVCFLEKWLSTMRLVIYTEWIRTTVINLGNCDIYKNQCNYLFTSLWAIENCVHCNVCWCVWLLTPDSRRSGKVSNNETFSIIMSASLCYL